MEINLSKIAIPSAYLGNIPNAFNILKEVVRR